MQKLVSPEAVERRFARFDEGSRAGLDAQEHVKRRLVASLPSCTLPEAKALTKGSTMTWPKFVHEVLPGAESITYIVPAARKPYAHHHLRGGRAAQLVQVGHEYSLYRWASGTLPVDFALNAARSDGQAIGLLPHMWDDLSSPQQGAFVYLDEGQTWKRPMLV